jgi:riboflavin synthase
MTGRHHLCWLRCDLIMRRSSAPHRPRNGCSEHLEPEIGTRGTLKRPTFTGRTKRLPLGPLNQDPYSGGKFAARLSPKVATLVTTKTERDVPPSPERGRLQFLRRPATAAIRQRDEPTRHLRHRAEISDTEPKWSEPRPETTGKIGDSPLFTGLIQAKTKVEALLPEGSGCRLVIRRPADTPEVRFDERVSMGASIAINGCCLTIVRYDRQTWEFEAGSETLSRTNLGRLHSGSSVNIETSLRMGDSLGGHWVTGHVDGLGTLVDRIDDGPWSHLRFKLPPHLAPQLASKGSITVDGVSLTLVEVTADEFTVALIPHTLQVTTLGDLQVGDPVNLETDVLAKYVQRQLEFLR